nr:hypothetical protein [Tanacetum cinerariifolium]
MKVVVVAVGGGVGCGGCGGGGAWSGGEKASEGEWCGGSDRSGDRDTFWVRRKNPAGKVFRRWSPAASGGRLELPPVVVGVGREKEY